jgi:hypothetical protein
VKPVAGTDVRRDDELMSADGDPIAELATALDAAAARATSDHSILTRFLEGRDPSDPELQTLANALRHPRQSTPGKARFGAMLVLTEDGTAHRPLAEVPDEECALWGGVAARLTEPSVIAWLNDLLFERRWGSVGDHRRRAFTAYLQVGASVSPPSIRSAEALQRAMELAKLGRVAAEVEAAVAAVVGAAAAGLGAEQSKPGVDLVLLELLTDIGDVAQLDDLLEKAQKSYASAHLVTRVIRLQMKRTRDPERRELLSHRLVRAWVDEAHRAHPYVMMLHLEKAAKIARDRGLPDLRDEVLLEMQQSDTPPIPSITVEVPSTVSATEIDALIESLVGDSWDEAVLRLVANGPPTGDVDRNETTASEHASENSLSSYFPVVQVGADGLPRHAPRDGSGHADLALIERMNLEHFGRVLTSAFDRAIERHDPPLHEIELDLKRRDCADAVARRIARALRRYADGDPEGAAYTALPLIERMLRDLLLSANAPVYRVQQGETRGQYEGLGAMLDRLVDRGFNRSWHRYLTHLLTAPEGPNLRNEAVHGFIDDIGEAGAAFILIAVLYLTFVHADREREGHDGTRGPDKPTGEEDAP